MDRFDPPLPGPRVSRVPRKSSVQKKDTKPDPSMCRRWDRLPLISSWVLSETGHPSPITHHPSPSGGGTRRQERNIQLHKDRREISITFSYGHRRV